MKIFKLILLLLFCTNSQAQSNFVKITSYFGVIHPLVSVSNNETNVNFRDYYTVGFPFGVNFWKTSKTAFSIEIIPYIKTDKGISKMNNILIHPGVVFDIGNGYRISTRAAFETAGRFGFTPIFTKTIYKAKSNSYYIALGILTGSVK